MAVDTHDPKDVILTIDGKIISGFPKGSFLTVERDEDSFSYQPNVDGGGTRSMNHNRAGKFTFQLARNSDSNQILSTLMLIDEQTGAGTFSVLVKDNRGSSLHAAETAWVVKPAAAEYADEATPREWVLQTDELVTNVGGLG